MKNDQIEYFSDQRSKRFVLVPFCALAQSFQAKSLVKYEWKGNLKPILKLLIDRDVNIIQMPCAETYFYGFAKGLNREPAGRKHYNTEEFREFCASQARDTIEMIEQIIENKYTVVAILGMEYSPACAVKMQYPPKKGGTPGFFIEELITMLNEKGIDCPVLGINRRGINGIVSKLQSILDNTEQIELDI